MVIQPLGPRPARGPPWLPRHAAATRCHERRGDRRRRRDCADLDLQVNNAGIVGFSGGEFTDPKWIEGGRQEMEVNFLGTFAVTQAFAPVLAKNGGGAIANLNSVASFVSFPMLASYSASKAATHSLTQVTRAMLRGQNTQVFGVYPGPIDTKMAEVLTLEKASPADAARAIVAGIIEGDEEIFPDRMSQGTGPEFFADPKGLERQVAGVAVAATHSTRFFS
jgi:NAD(P)-dependent dehydrogenase (short-subunit alcohol dehydrogenase family)